MASPQRSPFMARQSEQCHRSGVAGENMRSSLPGHELTSAAGSTSAVGREGASAPAGERAAGWETGRQRASKPLRAGLKLGLRLLWSVSLGVSLSLALTGCGGFFVYPGSTTTTTTGTGSGGSTTTDFAYVANSSSGSTYVNGYVISSGLLTAATGSPFNLDYTPTAISVTPNNGFVYMGTDSTVSTAAIYGYSIGTAGALSILNSGSALVTTENVSALAISPDGNWLFALDALSSDLEEYAINTSTGALTLETSYNLSGANSGVITPYSVQFAPTGDFLACALGTGGIETFAFDTTTGAANATTVISPASSANGVYAIAIDGNNNLYAAGTAGLQVFSDTTAGTPTLLNTYTVGNAPRAIVLSSTYDYVYVANEADSTISGFSISNGALTALSGSPFAAPTGVDAIGRDSTGAYILAEGYNATSGIELYSIGTTGALAESSEAASGTTTSIPVVVGLTP